MRSGNYIDPTRLLLPAATHLPVLVSVQFFIFDLQCVLQRITLVLHEKAVTGRPMASLDELGRC